MNPATPLSSTSISESDALIELTQSLFSRPDVGSLLSLVKNLASRLVQADRSSIFVFDRQRNELWTVMTDATGMIRVPSDKGIVGEVIRTGKPLAIEDAAKDSRFYAQVDRETGYSTKTILCVPLPGRDGKPLGAIELLNKVGGVFTASDERALSVLGIQTGLAIEHLEMYEDVRNNCAQVQLLLDIQKNINVAMEAEQIIEAILSRLIDAAQGVCGVMQTITRNGTVCYHGHLPEKGYRYWEEIDRRSWPDAMNGLRAEIDRIPPSALDTGFYQSPTLVYARLGEATPQRGYLAVLLNESRTRPFNPVPLDHVKVIAEQAVSLLDKQESIEERRRSEKQAMLGSMLAMIVHDMKNPLSGITGFAQLIKRKAVEPKVHEYCDIIVDALTRVERMNSELLMFVKGESIELVRTTFSLVEFMQSIVNMMSVACQRDEVAVRLECPPSLQVHADKDRLARVITNILSNAREAIGKGGTISIAVLDKGNGAEIAIEDTGKGIPARVLERIFEPFVTYGKKNGTGLGMSIARSIIEKHNGSIQVKSMLGKGTTFTIWLPSDQHSSAT